MESALACLLLWPGAVAAPDPQCMSPYLFPSGFATPPSEVKLAELCHPRCQSFYDVMRSLVDVQSECSPTELGGMVMSTLCSDQLYRLDGLCAGPGPASHARFGELAKHLPDSWHGANFGPQPT
ncbi:hypothetical protein T492DRAFT_869037 [Pavlovales sp. CCMP2436]|nr:hypothetical protein T492DRAFT_869037 [Pavlovales sp. CCMP2436]